MFKVSFMSVTTKPQAADATGVGVIICRDFLLTTGMLAFVRVMLLL